MFSGGIDSTTAAVILGRYFDRVHLLTYQNGYGHYGMEKVQRRHQELVEKLGKDKYTFQLRSTKPLFEWLVMNNMAAEFGRWKSGFIWCMGCKLAMHTMSIIHNLENRIPFMGDGSSHATQEMVEQSIISVSMIKFLYEEYGIQFLIPVYDIPREEEKRRLKELGLYMGIPILDRALGIQPRCLWGEIYYLPYLLFNKPPKHDEFSTAKFIEEKQELVRKYIHDYFASKGQEVPKIDGKIEVPEGMQAA